MLWSFRKCSVLCSIHYCLFAGYLLVIQGLSVREIFWKPKLWDPPYRLGWCCKLYICCNAYPVDLTVKRLFFLIRLFAIAPMALASTVCSCIFLYLLSFIMRTKNIIFNGKWLSLYTKDIIEFSWNCKLSMPSDQVSLPRTFGVKGSGACSLLKDLLHTL